MIGVVGIFTWTTPGDMHLAGGQVDYHGSDGLLPVQRVVGVHGVIADRVGEIDMVALDGLQGLDGVLLLSFDQSQSAKVAHVGADQIYRIALDLLHGRCEVMVGMYDIPVLSIQNGKMTG